MKRRNRGILATAVLAGAVVLGTAAPAAALWDVPVSRTVWTGGSGPASALGCEISRASWVSNPKTITITACRLGSYNGAPAYQYTVRYYL